MSDLAELPAPLLPTEVDLQDFAFMPLDVARLRDSDLTSDETPEACWAAVLLWCASWHQIPAGSIPDNEQWIAKQAGYVSRGRIDSQWHKIKDGALRGWVKCSDGRLYHAVVAEKALDAWKSKLAQRWRSECGRIKKHNQRHDTSLPIPDFEEWLSLDCPQGQPLAVPRDTPSVSQGSPEKITSKRQREGQGQGQGQGQGESKPSVPEPAEADPPAEQKNLPAAKAAGPKKSDGDQNETELQAACRETLRSYASAYWDRYQTEPVVNAKVRSQIKQFCQRLAHDEAPQVAAFYVTHQSSYYVRKCHDIGGMLSDAEKLRTEWATNRQGTGGQANQVERMASNLAASDEALAILEAKGLA